MRKIFLFLTFFFLLFQFTSQTVLAAVISGAIEVAEGAILVSSTDFDFNLTCSGIAGGSSQYNMFWGRTDGQETNILPVANITFDTNGNFKGKATTNGALLPGSLVAGVFNASGPTTKVCDVLTPIQIIDPSQLGSSCTIETSSTGSPGYSNNDTVSFKLIGIPSYYNPNDDLRIWFDGGTGNSLPSGGDCRKISDLKSSVNIGTLGIGSYTIKVSKSCGFADSSNLLCNPKTFTISTGGNSGPGTDTLCHYCPANCKFTGTDPAPACSPKSGAPAGTNCITADTDGTTYMSSYCDTVNGLVCDPNHVLGCHFPPSVSNVNSTGTNWGTWGNAPVATALGDIARFLVGPKPGNAPAAVGHQSMINLIINLLIFISILLALFYLVWGGVDWLTSRGDRQKLSSARQKIVFAIIGLIIVFLAYLIVNIILKLFRL